MCIQALCGTKKCGGVLHCVLHILKDSPKYSSIRSPHPTMLWVIVAFYLWISFIKTKKTLVKGSNAEENIAIPPFVH